MATSVLLFLLSHFLALAHAYKTFQTNCTSPSIAVNFVSSNNTRGTIDILWSCLFTIVACTWTVQHLNVPEQRDGRDEGLRGDIKWALKRIWNSAKWMLVTAVAPEVMISKSIGDLLCTKANLERLKQLAKEDDVPWSRTHSLFANMGGFVIRGNVPDRVGKSDGPTVVTGTDQEPDGTLQTQATSNIQASQEPSKEKSIIDLETSSTAASPECTDLYYLVASDLITLRKAGHLKRLPYIPTTELNDKSKSDGLVRFIAITQILWIVIQIIVRASRHLAVSQLEIAVVAFSICAIVIYCLNWEKPKGVQVPYTLLQYRCDIPKPVLSYVGKGVGSTSPILHGMLEILWGLVRLKPPYDDEIPGSRIRNHFTPRRDVDYGQIAGLAIGGMVFGAIHIVAWDFVFPTIVEQKLWWAASIFCTATSIFLLAFIMLEEMWLTQDDSRDLVGFLLLICMFFLPICLYIAARLFLLLEIFRTLLFLPPSAYVSTWAANVPHIA